MLKFIFPLHITVWSQKEIEQMKNTKKTHKTKQTKKKHNLYVKENANRGYCYSQEAHSFKAAYSVFFSNATVNICKLYK